MPAFDNLLIVVAVAFAGPLLLGFFPSVRLPSVVLEILAGIVIGPSVLGIVHIDEAISVISLLGLAFLLQVARLYPSSRLRIVPNRGHVSDLYYPYRSPAVRWIRRFVAGH